MLAKNNETSVKGRSLDFDLDPRVIWQDMNGGEADILDAGEFEQ